MLRGVLCEDPSLDTREPVDWEECLGCAASWQNPCSLPYPVLKAVHEDCLRPHAFPSVTSLTGCLRRSWLMHTRDYYDYPSGRLALLVGSQMHAALELAAEEAGAIPEIKVRWTTQDGIQINGTADLYVRVNGSGVLQDWKTAKAIWLSKLPYGTHAVQVNLYAFMLEHNELEPRHPVDVLRMVYLSKSGPDTKNGEHNGVVQINVDKWDAGVAEQFLNTNARTLGRALDDGTPPPKTSERWLCSYRPVVQQCEAIGN